jgi:hypothetical protein
MRGRTCGKAASKTELDLPILASFALSDGTVSAAWKMWPRSNCIRLASRGDAIVVDGAVWPHGHERVTMLEYTHSPPRFLLKLHSMPPAARTVPVIC